jgi:4,5-DOPA dioxygenase extradiol
MREQGVLILGSGGITHNLSDFRQQATELPYVSKFAHWIRNAIIGNNIDQLLAYREHAPHASQAHPSDEHLLPLFIALGARTDGEQLNVIEGGIAYGILSMDSYMWQSVPQ